jgi:TetR/AcrR family transcriptional repressor of nem operon
MSYGRPLAYDPETALDAAMHLFWRQGYKATSLQDLLQAMGLSKSSFYQAFGSKKALFLRCVDRYSRKVAGRLRGWLAESRSGLDFIERILLAAGAEAEKSEPRRGCLLMNTATELAQQDPVIAARVSEGFVGLGEIFAEAVRRGQREGEITTEENAGNLADYLVCSLGGIRAVVKGGADEVKVKGTVAVILRGLR